MQLDLELSLSFLVLLQERHFGRAAARLHISPAALTKRIQRLEHHLGLPLLERDTGGVVGATRAGCRFADGVIPLISQAQSVVRATRVGNSAASPLRVGVPAGTTEFLQIIKLTDIIRQIRHDLPGAIMQAVDVPFPALDSCLLDHRVDILLTIGPVLAPLVESVPLPVTADRAAVVNRRHNFAAATSIDVAELVDQPMIYNPLVPDEFMRWFWLADVRPRRQAQLKQIDATDKDASIVGVTNEAVMVTLGRARNRLPPWLTAVNLVGVPPVRFYAARRRADKSELTRRLFAEFNQMSPVRF